MSFPTFLLQSGDVMSREKIACAFSEYPVRYTSYEGLSKLPKESITEYVPVGSVEFTRRYCDHLGMGLPGPLFLLEDLKDFYHREVRFGTLSEASMEDFVKPSQNLKLFTGCFKSELGSEVDESTPVFISKPVPFGAEFRFYIHDFITGPKIFGWSRYDDHPSDCPEPWVNLVEKIAHRLHESLGPSAYSIDIGWRRDIGRYSLVEINDGWSLGLYENHDPQSSPPSRKDYAEMLISRWRQIVFCSIV